MGFPVLLRRHLNNGSWLCFHQIVIRHEVSSLKWTLECIWGVFHRNKTNTKSSLNKTWMFIKTISIKTSGQQADKANIMSQVSNKNCKCLGLIFKNLWVLPLIQIHFWPKPGVRITKAAFVKFSLAEIPRLCKKFWLNTFNLIHINSFHPSAAYMP